MAFSLKTWVNRISEYPNRRKLTHEDGSTELVTVARAEGQISAEGNAFSAEEMNDLENRIKGGFDEVNQSLTQLNERMGGFKYIGSVVAQNYSDVHKELDHGVYLAIANTGYWSESSGIWFISINVGSSRVVNIVPSEHCNFTVNGKVISWTADDLGSSAVIYKFY